jgi:flagellar motor switch protein FliM
MNEQDRYNSVQVLKGSEIIGTSLKKDREYKIKLYDFKRPDKFSREQIITLSIIHETFSRLCSTTLSAMLRGQVKIKVACVDQLTYGEFIQSIQHIPVMGILNMEPLKGAAVLEFDGDITFAVVERLFGGEGNVSPAKRSLTHIERTFMEETISRILGDLAKSWSKIIALKPELRQIETNPAHAQIVFPTEMIVLVTFDVVIDGTKGKMNLCLPYLTIEPIISRLSALFLYSSSLKRDTYQPNRFAGDMKVDAEIFYRGDSLSLKELGALKRNSMIKLPDYQNGKAFLRAGGEDVLEIRRKENRAKAFSVIETKKDTDNQWMPVVEKESPEEVRLAKLIEHPLNAFTFEMKKGMGRIENSITELVKRQDALTDRLYYRTGDEEGIDKAAGSGGEVRGGKPFDFITIEDCDNLSNLIAGEHPQTLALILSYLDSGIASTLLTRLPEQLQVDVVERIATLNRIAPEVLVKLERILEYSLNTIHTSTYHAGGIDAITDILNISSRSVEKNVIFGLEKSNRELAEKIKANMFVFEDIVLLDPDSTSEVIKAADRNDLLKALKSVPEQVRDYIYDNFPGDELETFKADFETLRRTRLSEVEAAQQRIVSVIRELEEAGAIVVLRPDEVVE